MQPGTLRVLVAVTRALRSATLYEHLRENTDLGEIVRVQTARAAMAEIRSGRPLHAVVWGLPRWQEALSRVQTERLDLPVLILSDLRERELAPLALRSGASGFVAWEGVLDELPHALRMAARGERYVSPLLAAVFAEAVATGGDLAGGDVLSGLSLREAQVVRLTGAGMSRAEIAEHMAVAPSTITTYRKRAMEKLGLRSSIDLVRFALRHRLVSNDPPPGE
ncbi:MAG: response regulator transcription factor [Bacteroidota bacterium]